MKKNGFTASNIYTLKREGDKMPRLSFCDMESFTGYEDPNMEQTIGYVNYSPTSEFIAFSAYAQGNFNNGEYITFDRFITESKDFFNISSGTFTAPAKGTYEFSFSGRHSSNNAINKIHVLKNGLSVAIFETSANAEQDYLSFTLSIDLDENDTARLKVLNGYTHLVFSGKLLSIS